MAIIGGVDAFLSGHLKYGVIFYFLSHGEKERGKHGFEKDWHGKLGMKEWKLEAGSTSSRPELLTRKKKHFDKLRTKTVATNGNDGGRQRGRERKTKNRVPCQSTYHHGKRVEVLGYRKIKPNKYSKDTIPSR